MVTLGREVATGAAILIGLALILWGPGLGLAGLGALIYLVASFVQPRFGLAGIVAALPLYLFPRQLGGFSVSLPEAALILCLIATTARVLVDRRRPKTDTWALQPSPYDAPIALFLAAALLSLLATEYLRLSLRELRTLIVEPVVFFYLVRLLVTTNEQARTIVDVLLVATAGVALLGITQLFIGGAVTDVQGVRRVHGTYMSPNHLGLLLGRALPFLVAGAWLLPRRRPIDLVGVVLCGLALILSFSVGAWLGTLAALLAVAALVGGRRALLYALIACAVAGLVALPILRVERVAAHLDPTQGTSFVRVQLWQAGFAMLLERPILGIGLDNFLYRYPTYVPTAAVMEPNLSHPHNLILQFWLQLGLLGLVAALWLLVRFARRTLPWTRPAVPRARRALAVGATASMVDFVVHGMIDNSYFLVDVAFIFWLTLAVGARGADRGQSGVRG
jgi:O-antigen ligase